MLTLDFSMVAPLSGDSFSSLTERCSKRVSRVFAAMLTKFSRNNSGIGGVSMAI